MGPKGGALPRSEGLVDAKHGDGNHQEDQDQANSHETAEGQAPVEGAQVWLAVPETVTYSAKNECACLHLCPFVLEDSKS